HSQSWPISLSPASSLSRMLRRHEKPYGSWQSYQRRVARDDEYAFISGESLVAIDSLRCCSGAVDINAERESRGEQVLAVSDGVAEVPGSVFTSGEHRKLCSLGNQCALSHTV